MERECVFCGKPMLKTEGYYGDRAGARVCKNCVSFPDVRISGNIANLLAYKPCPEIKED